MKKLWWLVLPVLTLLISCERAIEFTPRNPEPAVVVEAVIENNRYPVVYLSRSLNFFSQISIDDLSNAFVKDAEVLISNGTSSYTLREYSVPVGNGYSLRYYTADSTAADLFKGAEGGSYQLIIRADGEEYTATTTIPRLSRKIDSLFYEENVDKEDSSKVVLYGKFVDPPGMGNYSRYFTSANGGPFRPGLNSVFDDQVIDGATYKVQIEKGVDRNADIDFEEYAYFSRGDRVTVKFCNIDKATFDFWRTMEYSYSSIGNPFSSPTKIEGNISNGALGYFGGYSVQYASIIIPE